jgi:hypothetical protein
MPTMFVIAINVENTSGIALSQMCESLYQQLAITANISGYYTIRTGGLARPIKWFWPSVHVQIRN